LQPSSPPAGHAADLDLGWLDAFGLAEREKIFVTAYLEHRNASQAARRAGCADGPGIHVQASRLIRRDNVKAAIQAGQDRLTQIGFDKAKGLVDRWWSIINTTPADIVTVKKEACRHCFGKDHEYQWRNENEYEAALNKAVWAMHPGEKEAVKRSKTRTAARKGSRTLHPDIPLPIGGFGFSPTKKPSPDCPNCAGRGVTIVDLPDVESLNEEQAAMIDGIKTTQHGVEVKFADRTKAMDFLARHLGLFDQEDDNSLSQLAGAIMQAARPVPVVPDTPDADDDPDTVDADEIEP